LPCIGPRLGQFKVTDIFGGVANLAMKSLVRTDISCELTYHRLLDSAAEEPIVRRLSAGGKWIRTIGPPSEQTGGLAALT
jgi:hypothetical protein